MADDNAMQGVTFDQQPTQAASAPSQNQNAGITFDQQPTQAQTGADTGEGLFSKADDAAGEFVTHAADTSGIKGLTSMISSEAAHRLSSYHKAVDAFKQGDLTKAAEHATAAASGMDKDDPMLSALTQIIHAPWEEAKAAYQEAKAASKSDPIEHGLLMTQHEIGAVPVLGTIAQDVGGKIDEDIQNHNYSGLLGDVVGFVSTLGLGEVAKIGEAGEVAGRVGEASDASKAGIVEKPGIRPTTQKIAGVDVPVSAPQLQDQSLGTRAVKKAATKEGAQQFINDRVQPAAQRASQANFTQSAVKAVNKLDEIRGEQPTPTPDMHSTDDIARHLENSAAKTYDQLDAAAAEDHKQWELKKAASEHAAEPPKTGAGGTDFSTVEPKDQAAAPKEFSEPEPKLFTELQTQIRDAEETLRSRTASATEKGAAAEKMPQYQAEMKDFLDKHGSAVKNGELDAADDAWKQAQRYKWVSKKLRTATTGTEGTKSALLQKPTTLNPKMLESMPAQFDNRFGEGSFNRLLGPEGMKNYNDILNVLRNPIDRSNLEEIVHKVVVGGTGAGVGAIFGGPFGATAGGAGSLVGKFGLSRFADQLLFNPEFGQRTLKVLAKAKDLWADESGSFTIPGTSPRSSAEAGGSGTAAGAARDTALFQQAKAKLGPDASISDVAKEAQRMKAASATPNGSGESAASQEAINRQASEKASGTKRVRIDTRTGKEVPLVGVDAVDAKAGPYDVVMQRGPHGEVELDRGRLARPTVQKAMRNVYGGTDSVLGGK